MIVVYCIVALLAIAGIAIIADLINRRNLKKKIEKGEIDEMPQVVQVDQECCGQHEICEKESKNIEYYNDEELDRFRGKDSSEYSEAETDEFREILYTMKDEEVAGWVRSLQLRNVPLPDAIKDEVFLIVGERRFDH